MMSCVNKMLRSSTKGLVLIFVLMSFYALIASKQEIRATEKSEKVNSFLSLPSKDIEEYFTKNCSKHDDIIIPCGIIALMQGRFEFARDAFLIADDHAQDRFCDTLRNLEPNQVQHNLILSGILCEVWWGDFETAIDKVGRAMGFEEKVHHPISRGRYVHALISLKAIALDGQGRAEAAISLLGSAHKKEEASEIIIATLADILARNGKTDDLGALRMSLEDMTLADGLLIRIVRAEEYRLKGDKASARREIQKAGEDIAAGTTTKSKSATIIFAEIILDDANQAGAPLQQTGEKEEDEARMVAIVRPVVGGRLEGAGKTMVRIGKGLVVTGKAVQHVARGVDFDEQSMKRVYAGAHIPIGYFKY